MRCANSPSSAKRLPVSAGVVGSVLARFLAEPCDVGEQRPPGFHVASRERDDVRDEIVPPIEMHVDRAQRLPHLVAARDDCRIPEIQRRNRRCPDVSLHADTAYGHIRAYSCPRGRLRFANVVEFSHPTRGWRSKGVVANRCPRCGGTAARLRRIRRDGDGGLRRNLRAGGIGAARGAPQHQRAYARRI